MMIGGLGLFNSYKLEIRYETNSNLELLYQNGIIISTLFIIYFWLAFFIEILVVKNKKKAFTKPLSATEFYEKHTKDEEE
jgi:hypothetical protein